ncbi:ribonuclease R [Lacticigenium naphthae]|uniref:ribonuclease R n=1 Tax=Lacticigenium naphthae TaxID=515351 RepID=UPI00040D1C5B|nr:ribonuclease R [Lacticigenium naphthae]
MGKYDALKESVLIYMDKSEKVAFEVNDISEGMELTGFREFKKLVNALADLEREGKVFLNKKGKFKLAVKKPVLSGKFRSNTKGFGFVELEEEEKDVFIPPNKTNFAMEGDIVSIRITKKAEEWRDRGAEGEVQSILERGTSQLVGEFIAYSPEEEKEMGLYGFVEPQNKELSDVRIFIERKGVKPVEGSIVQVEITQYPTKDLPHGMQGIVTSVIGHKNDPGVDILTVVYKHGIPAEFPQEVIEEANRVPDEITKEDLKGRVDLRDEVIVTIDGADAKDLDDAIGVKKLSNGNYYLGVHIADVSHYVKENKAIDKEAYERGTSVYLTDRVIPMIPQRLSNGICSLNPNVDRLTMSCTMEIDSKGNVIDHDIFPSVIRSSQRMTYQAVNEILDEENPTTRNEYADLIDMFDLMAELHHILEAKREKRGSIDFDSKEAKILVDEDGKPLDIVLRERGVGERLIESFMLAANETVSEHYAKKQLPILFRIHEQPDEEKMQRFLEFVTGFGINVKGTKDTVSPKNLQKVMEQVKGKTEEAVISMLMLRSMKQAKYDVEPIGHFGLGADYYSHFTSPIRRYPDLILHRLIHTYIDEGTSQAIKKKWNEKLPDIAERSSMTERRAVDAERETDEMKKAEYMLSKVGEIFDGIIVSITGFGMFIQLPNTVEGLVHVSTMKDDYYEFNERGLMLIGERAGKVYRIGQTIKVKLVSVDPDIREIDFEIVLDKKDQIEVSNKKPVRSSKPKSKSQAQSKPKSKSQSTSGKKSSGKPNFKVRQTNQKTDNKNKKKQ